MNILVIDIETTSFLKTGGKIIEIGAVSLDLETGYVEEQFNSLLREPGLTARDRDAWIFQNSDLTVEDVRNAEPSDVVLARFQEVVDRFPDGVTSFNRSFDIDFLVSRGIKFGKLQPCPMQVSTNICKILSPYGYKWPSVVECYAHFFPEYEYSEAHRALSDAVDESVIVLYLYKYGHYKPL